MKPTQVWLTACMIREKDIPKIKKMENYFFFFKFLVAFEYVLSNNITDNIHSLAF